MRPVCVDPVLVRSTHRYNGTMRGASLLLYYFGYFTLWPCADPMLTKENLSCGVWCAEMQPRKIHMIKDHPINIMDLPFDTPALTTNRPFSQSRCTSTLHLLPGRNHS